LPRKATPKPRRTIKPEIALVTKDGSVIYDFPSGSIHVEHPEGQRHAEIFITLHTAGLKELLESAAQIGMLTDPRFH
jgi:hypothetical protein